MSRLSIFTAIAATLLTVTGFSAAAQAQCQPFPQVWWWGQSSHPKEIRIVGRQFGGDWGGYIARWEERLSRLEEIHANGNTAVLGSRRVELRDSQLDTFIETVRQRLTVTRCLADDAASVAKTATNDAETIGGGGADRIARKPNMTRLSSTLPDLEVWGRCRKSATEFRVTNTGGSWPDVAAISIVDGAGNPLTRERRMRLTEGQNATFRIDRADTDATAVALKVEPAWSDASPHEARIDCRNSHLAARRSPSLG